jgi:alkylation response protein AidB-like acyl-CoA dehydrogenase
MSLDPSAARDPLAIADELARSFASTAAERDKRGGTPKAERDLLRRSGLLSLLVPEELGGAGAGWPLLLGVVRRFAEVDGAIAHVYGFQHLMLATVRLFGSGAQWRRLARSTVERSWFWGNALNPLDPRTTITPPRGGERVLQGVKSFCSGATDSDMLIVSATQPGEARLVIAAIPTDRAGVVVHQDWDNMGQRQTDSGTVELRDVLVSEDEILSTPGPLGSVLASLRPCIAQLTFATVYLGIAEGALAEAGRYTRAQTRAWFASGVERPTEDPYVLRRYGEMWVGLEAARALTEKATLALQRAWDAGDALSPEARGACALAIAAAKVATTRAGLEITSGMFDVTGARATTAAAGLDRYWRNLRTHTLHDPVDYKIRELGDHALNGALPKPSFYS